jgi:energy-coupling factor transporter ATP-binding protein EcfA2
MHESWINKVIQLYETYLVRHGIMLVGPTGGGKSAIEECLAGALTELGTKHVIWRMNPKAVTAPQMFGRMVSTGPAAACVPCCGAARNQQPANNQPTGGVSRAVACAPRACAVLWRRAAKEPTTNQQPPSCPAGRVDRRLDRRRVCRAVAPRREEQEPEHVDRARRPGRRDLDRESQHRAGRQQGVCTCTRAAHDPPPWAS